MKIVNLPTKIKAKLGKRQHNQPKYLKPYLLSG
jgi:hypothetical protein